jgi:hypothetical protein
MILIALLPLWKQLLRKQDEFPEFSEAVQRYVFNPMLTSLVCVN